MLLIFFSPCDREMTTVTLTGTEGAGGVVAGFSCVRTTAEAPRANVNTRANI